ncbi:MAG: recombinase family protein [Lachnospiraceae bacterium]|nr:recombinase family protein [Lachnospiraceae bacterium]
MGKVYGYCRISTKKQNIERQERNIRLVFPEAIIIREVYTGSTFQGRAELNKIIKQVREGDTLVFDSLSRMSRDAESGFVLYDKLFKAGIRMVFLKEPHINTDVYKKAMRNQIKLTGTSADIILEAVNQYLMELAREQIRIAFEQAEKEVTDLRQRTREGIETARLNGKRIGLEKGGKLVTQKSIKAKEQIRKYSRDFGGVLNDMECIQMIGISRGTFYKYKREMRCEALKM